MELLALLQILFGNCITHLKFFMLIFLPNLISKINYSKLVIFKFNNNNILMYNISLQITMKFQKIIQESSKKKVQIKELLIKDIKNDNYKV
jgi:hypothetical protein